MPGAYVVTLYPLPQPDGKILDVCFACWKRETMKAKPPEPAASDSGADAKHRDLFQEGDE